MQNPIAAVEQDLQTLSQLKGIICGTQHGQIHRHDGGYQGLGEGETGQLFLMGTELQFGEIQMIWR